MTRIKKNQEKGKKTLSKKQLRKTQGGFGPDIQPKLEDQRTGRKTNLGGDEVIW